MNLDNSSRSRKLDFLRGLAVLLVLGRHLPDVPSGNGFFLSLARAWQRGGWIGVDLFFVLSGFLVSGLFFQEWSKHRSLDPVRFLIRRGFKIYPGYYVMLAVSVFWLFPGIGWPHILVEALFLRNYFLGSYGFWEHTWSLAIEEHFYFSLALVFWLISLRKTSDPFRIVPWLCLGVGTACLAGRVIGHQIGIEPSALFFQSHFRFDSLSFGVCLSYWYHHDRKKLLSCTNKFRWVLLPLAILSLFLCFVLPCILDLRTYYLYHMFGLTLVYLGFGALLLLTLVSTRVWEQIPFSARRSIAFVGFYSYSIYLWHAPMKKIYLILFPRYLGIDLNFWQASGVYLVGAVCQGVFMAVIVELPFLKLRNRLFPSKA